MKRHKEENRDGCQDKIMEFNDLERRGGKKDPDENLKKRGKSPSKGRQIRE